MSPRGDIYRPLRESRLNPDRPAQFPACHSQQSGVSVCNPSIAQLSVWTHARAGTGSDPIHRLHYDTDVRRCAEDHEMRARFGVFFFFRDLVIGDGLLDPRLDRAGKIIPAAFSKSIVEKCNLQRESVSGETSLISRRKGRYPDPMFRAEM